jgi:hypothetical protein
MTLQAARRLTYAVGTATTLVLVTVCIYTLIEMRFTRNIVARSVARQNELLARHHDEFMEDQRLAATLKVFARRQGNRDASPTLGPRVSWIVSPAAQLQTESSGAAGSGGDWVKDSLPKEVHGDWLDIDPALWKGLDFSWMAKLGDYDFWELDTNSERASLTNMQLPIPGLELVNWAKLRLAKGIHDGTLDEAMSEVEELARLYATTENIVTVEESMMFIALIDKTRARFVLHGPVRDDIGQPAEADTRWHVHRALRGALAYTDLTTPAVYEADWNHIAVGRCAALAYGLNVALYARPFLMHSYAGAYERLGRLLASSPKCRLRRTRQLWARPASVKATAECGTWQERFLSHWLPSACTLTGELAVTIARQGWLERYEKPAFQ